MAEKPKLGQPTKYQPDYCHLIIEYFSEPPYREVTKKRVIGGEVVEFTEEKATDFPTMSGFAIQVGVHRTTLNEWAKQFPEFDHALKTAKEYEYRWLQVNGLKGLIPSNFAMFAMKNLSGWRDKQEGENNQVIEHKGETKTVVVTMDLEDRVKLLKDVK